MFAFLLSRSIIFLILGDISIHLYESVNTLTL